MREIKMTEITQIEIESIWKCEYCGRPLPAPVDRVDVIDVRSHRILYVYCQTHKCMQAHLKAFYDKWDPTVPNHVCYENGCMERQ